MSIVNFSITNALEERINPIIKEMGFSSRAEFFRFLAINFIANHPSPQEKQYEKSVEELAQLIQKKAKKKKLPSLESQLADLAA